MLSEYVHNRDRVGDHDSPIALNGGNSISVGAARPTIPSLAFVQLSFDIAIVDIGVPDYTVNRPGEQPVPASHERREQIEGRLTSCPTLYIALANVIPNPVSLGAPPAFPAAGKSCSISAWSKMSHRRASSSLDLLFLPRFVIFCSVR